MTQISVATTVILAVTIARTCKLVAPPEDTEGKNYHSALCDFVVTFPSVSSGFASAPSSLQGPDSDFAEFILDHLFFLRIGSKLERLI
jgi:hypothetical protein